MCRETHVAPIDIIARIFFGNNPDCVIWGNRSGGKSYMAGVITWLRSALMPHCGTRILAGSGDQAKKSYKAIGDYWQLSGMQEQLLEGEPLMSETRYKNKSHVEILTCSQKSVRGPHQQNLIVDEVEEVDPDVYEAALSQPQAAHGISSSTIVMSTMHKRYGPMAEMLREERRGLELFKFCIWETVGPCRPTYTDSACKSMCPLQEWCPRTIRDSKGYYPFPDLLKKLKVLSLEAFLTEWLCERPSRVGAIYEEFDPEIHGIDRDFDPTKEVELSIDFGGADPFVVGVWQHFPDLGEVQVDEIYVARTTNLQVIEMAKEKPWWKNIQGAVCDPSREDSIREWTDALPDAVVEGAKTPIEEGISEVKNCLKPVQGKPILWMNAEKCPNAMREMEAYHRGPNGKPVDKDNHQPDCIRYHAMSKKEQEPQIFFG